MIPQYVQGIVAEFRNDQRSRRRADPLDRPAGKVVEDRLCAGGHGTLDMLRLELLAMGRMAHPCAPGRYLLPRNGHGDTADHDRLLAVVQLHPKNGIPVFLIIIDDCRNTALDFFQIFFRHYHTTRLITPAVASDTITAAISTPRMIGGSARLI